ncbi:hypothetical protein [Woodsholea maritima]|uniref:hypothetical protein n=1 Tax=Woodsholea maritima TaxID=240237 RepID=UPI00035E8969|nr:hypothetical protein [Woodsholea maritima]
MSAFKDLKRNARYFKDPLLLFGVLWAALTIFSFVQNLADFDLGQYMGVVLENFRKLSNWLSDFIIFPFNLALPFEIDLPPLGDDALTIWVLLAGITARTQQLKFRKQHDEVPDLFRDPDMSEGESEEEIAATIKDRQSQLKRQGLLCVPVNLVVWPLVVIAELNGCNSPPQILNLRMLYSEFFGEKLTPYLKNKFVRTAQTLFILQWLYIFGALIIFFAINALETYLDKPGII